MQSTQQVYSCACIIQNSYEYNILELYDCNSYSILE